MAADKSHIEKKDGLSVQRILDHIEESLKKKKIPARHRSHLLRPKSKQSILILTTKSFGKGHLTAAKSLMEAFDTYHADQYEVTMLDPFRECNAFIDQALKACYDGSVKYAPALWKWFFTSTSNDEQTRVLNILSYPFIVDKLAGIMADINPDLIISTYPPLWNLALKKVLDELQIAPKTINVITDSMVVHRGWVTESTDHYMVANEETRKECISLSVDPKQVHAFGFPVGLSFERSSAKPERAPGEPLHALMMLGTGVTARDLQLVFDLKNTYGSRLHMTVITGKNEDMYRKLMAANLPKPLTVVGWTDRVADFMHQADVILTKAGGATVMECIATRTPLIVTKVIPGQEEGNAQTIKQYDIGVIAPSTQEVINAVGSFIAFPEFLESKRENFEAIHKKDAAKQIVDFAVRYVEARN